LAALRGSPSSTPPSTKRAKRSLRLGSQNLEDQNIESIPEEDEIEEDEDEDDPHIPLKPKGNYYKKCLQHVFFTCFSC
jgi:hypothetical protein